MSIKIRIVRLMPTIRFMTGTTRLGVRKAGNSVGKLIMSASMAFGSRNVETATKAESENNSL